MNEKELEGAKKLIENKDVKKGSYSFIGNSNITYADIKILLDYIKQLEQENQQLKEKYNKALKILTEYNLPCEIDNFNTKEENLEYCSKNCSVDEDVFTKCWDRFIEQELEKEW